MNVPLLGLPGEPCVDGGALEDEAERLLGAGRVQDALRDAQALLGAQDHLAVRECHGDLAFDAEEELVGVVGVRWVLALVADEERLVLVDPGDGFRFVGVRHPVPDRLQGHLLGHEGGMGPSGSSGCPSTWMPKVEGALPIDPLMLKVAPSILSADFGRLADEVKAIEDAGADYVHVDVMDGRFVPNITIGPVVVKDVKKATALPLDCHLMIVEPERYIDDFVQAGADSITVHQEASPHLHRTIQQIQGAGAKAGVSLNPSTPVSTLEHVIHQVDLVLIMTVNPGFGGQGFIPECVPKITQVVELAKRHRLEDAPPLEIEVDGGINSETARIVERAGATMAVAGSAVYNTPDYAAAIRGIRGSQKKLVAES